MTPTPVRVKFQYYFTCPNPACTSTHEHHVGHLIDGNWVGGLKADSGSTFSFGPWACKDCQHNLYGTLTRQADGHIELATRFEPIPLKDQNHTGLVLLRSTNGDGSDPEDPYYIVVKDDYCANVPEGNTYKDFSYSENTCLTNWSQSAVALIRNTVAFISQEDTDPHGLFEFVTLRTQKEIAACLHQLGEDTPYDLEHLDQNVLHALFPTLFSVTLEGQVVEPLKRLS